MIKFIIKMTLVLVFFCSFQQCFAHDCSKGYFPDAKERDKIDKMIEERLQLTKEQKDHLHKAKQKNRKEIEKAVKKMQEKHDEISRIYMLGLPRFQSDMRAAPKKAELVILKQNADRIKENQRKDFESILTTEQKVEFDKIKKEFAIKRAQSRK